MRGFAALGLILLSLTSPLAKADEKISRPGVYSGYSQARYSEWVKTSRYVTVRDGTRLAVDIIRPAVNGRAVDERLPVIWTHTPYRRAYVDKDGKKVSAVEWLGMIELVKHGYVMAAVDTRGRGASFGIRRGFQDRTEAQDAYDMTEWFAAQPWSSGAIGVMGCSYVGGSTYHVATTAPPHLRAIAPGCTDFDKYGFVSRGGITAQFNTRPENPGQDFGQGVLPVDEDADGKLAAEAIASHVKGTPMAELWAGMPFRDDVSPLLHVPFWKEASVATYAKTLEKSGIGIFIWGNWLDEGSFEATLAFNNLNNPRKLWMGGWAHCQVGDFPMATEMLRFFDHFLKNVDNGWEREPPIYYYTVGAAKGQEWRSAKQWPLPESRAHQFWLDSDGSLSLTRKLSGSDAFKVNYSPVCQDKADLYFIMWPCVIEHHGLGYETPPLEKDLHLAGSPLVDLWISSTNTDADVFVYLEDLSPEGEVKIVTHGRLRASLRSEQKPPFRNYMNVPYHRGNRADAKPLVPGEPARLRLDLLPTSTLIKAGHRLRITVAGADPRQRSRSVQFDPAPTVTIYRDAKHASSVSVRTLSEPAFRASEAYGAEDVGQFGYVEQEVFVSGRANEYRYDDQFNVIVAQRDIPYTTRLLIRKPSDPKRFSGVVHFETAHPVQGGSPMWSAARRYIVERGDAYALLVTGEDAMTRGGSIAPEREALRAQLQPQGAASLGVLHTLMRFDPQRYAPIVWPDNDAPRWDSIAKTGALLKSNDPQNPLAAAPAKRLYAEGWSFTGSLLRTFINEGFHDQARLPDGKPVFDGYLIGISSSTFVSGVVSLTSGTPTLPLGHPRRVTRSIDVPVIELMTENEAVTNTGPQAPENDSGVGRHRLYEVPGLTHGDGLAEPGEESSARLQLAKRGMSRPMPEDKCPWEHSDVPMGHLASAALENLDAWVTKGMPPPRAERLSSSRDKFGNALGGVRVAQVDVPLATYAVPSANACPASAGPFKAIRRQPLEVEKLRAEYGDEKTFLARFDARLQELVAQRWLRAVDAERERVAARAFADKAWAAR